MVTNKFFPKKGPFPLKKILEKINCTNSVNNINNIKIHDIQSLSNANETDLTFLSSILCNIELLQALKPPVPSLMGIPVINLEYIFAP